MGKRGSIASAKTAAAKKKVRKQTETEDRMSLEAKASADPGERTRHEGQVYAAKCLRDTYKTLSHEEKYTTPRDGKVLSLRLCDDWMAGESMGMSYHNARRVEYQCTDCPASLLRAVNEEQCDPRVRQAVVALKSTAMNTRTMAALFDLDEELDLNNSCAMLLCFFHVKFRAGTLHHVNFLLDGMRWILRTKVHERFSEQVELCRNVFKEVLMCHFALQKRDGLIPRNWWPKIKDVAPLALDAVAFETCVKHEGAWTEIKKQLLITTSESAVGLRMFGQAVRSIEAESVGDVIKQSMTEFVKEKIMSDEVLRKHKTKFLETCKTNRWEAAEAFVKPRMLNISYFDREFNFPATSYLDWWMHAAWGEIKTAAVLTKVLPALFYEKRLVSHASVKRTCKVDPSLLANAITARSKITIEMGAPITAMMKERTMFLCGIDKYAKTDIWFWAVFATT